MDLTTILLIKLSGGFFAMILAYATCFTMEKIITIGKKILLIKHNIHWANSHHA